MLITVWNNGFAQREHQQELAEELRRICHRFRTLGLKGPHDVSVCVPDGWMHPEDPTTVIVELFDKALSLGDRQELAKALGTTLQKVHHANALYRVIRVMVRPTVLNELDREALWTTSD